MVRTRFARWLPAAAFCLSFLAVPADAAPPPSQAPRAAMAAGQASSQGQPISRVVRVTATKAAKAGICTLPTPALSVAPSSVDFGTVAHDTLAGPVAFTITNTGTGSLMVNSLVPIDPLGCSDPGIGTRKGEKEFCSRFSVLPGTCPALPFTLPPGGSCSPQATFMADGGAGDSVVGSIEIHSNDAGTPYSLPAVASIGAGLLSVPEAVNGVIDVGAVDYPLGDPPTTSRTVTLLNTGTAPIDLTGISLSAANFSRTGGTCPSAFAVPYQQLAAGASCTVTISFTAPGIGIFGGLLFLEYNTGSGYAYDSIGLRGVGTSTSSLIDVDPITVSLDPSAGGEIDSVPVVVTNLNSTQPYDIQSVSVPSPFVISSDGCSAATLPPAGQCSFLVSNQPLPGGSTAQENITIIHGPVGTPVTSSFPASVRVSPTIAWNPSSFAFPDTVVGGSPSTAVLTLENHDAQSYPVSISLSYLYLGDPYQVTGGTCVQSGLIPASPTPGTPGTCTVDVKFAPPSTSIYPDYVNAVVSTSEVDIYAFVNYIEGYGVSPGPRILSTPGSIYFPPGPQGSPVQQSVTVQNVGDSATPTALVFNTNPISEVSVSPPSCGPLPAGGSCAITVTYARATIGSVSGNIIIQSTDTTPVVYQYLYASGSTAAVQPPRAEAAPLVLAFPATHVNTDSTPLEVSLGNTGEAGLVVTGITSSSPEFIVTNDCPASPSTLAGGSCCLATVVFRPSASGTRSGTLTVATDAGNLVVAVSGDGIPTVPPDVAKLFTPSSVQVGAASTLTVSLSNSNAFALTNLAFTDNFPAGLQVAATPAPSNTCGGTVTATAGGNSLALSGGTLPAASLAAPTVCSVSVAVQAPAASPGLVNTIPAGGVTSTETASLTSAAASATLVVSVVPVPSISVSPLSLAFPAQTVGTLSAPQKITVSSIGTAPLAISGVSVAGDYSVSSPCTALSPLPPSATCDIDVTFGPVLSGVRDGQVAIASNDPATPTRVVDLTGQGVAAPSPNVSLSPASIAFPPSTAGQASQPLTATLANTGGAPLAILAVEVVGAGFTLTHNCGASVAPLASCTLSATFLPPAAGSFAASVRIVSNSPGSPHFLGLTGSATAAPAGRLSASPPSLAFGDQLLGTASIPQPFTVTNTGNATASISAISVAPEDFAVDGSCIDLRPGESCAFRASFTPTTLGVRIGRVAFTTDASNSPFAVTLSGVGVPLPAPRVQLSASSLGYGNRLVGTGATLPVTVTNIGTADLVFGAPPQVSGGDFHASGGCAGSLAPGQSCRIEVGFVPTIPGGRTGELRFASNAEGSPHRVGLAGTGCRFQLSGRNLALVCAP